MVETPSCTLGIRSGWGTAGRMGSGRASNPEKADVPGKGTQRDTRETRQQDQLTERKRPGQDMDFSKPLTNKGLRLHLCFGPNKRQAYSNLHIYV